MIAAIGFSHMTPAEASYVLSASAKIVGSKLAVVYGLSELARSKPSAKTIRVVFDARADLLSATNVALVDCVKSDDPFLVEPVRPSVETLVQLMRTVNNETPVLLSKTEPYALLGAVVKKASNGGNTLVSHLTGITYSMTPGKRREFRGLLADFLSIKGINKAKALASIKQSLLSGGAEQASADLLCALLKTRNHRALLSLGDKKVPSWSSPFEVNYLKDLVTKRSLS